MITSWSEMRFDDGVESVPSSVEYRWASGMDVAMHVDQYDAWLKARGTDRSAIFCGILYLDHPSAAGAP